MASISDTRITITVRTGEAGREARVAMVRIKQGRRLRPGGCLVVVIGLLSTAWMMDGGALIAQVSLPGVSATQQPQQQNTALPSSEHAKVQAQMRAATLRLDSGDLLEITTFDTPELSGKFRVDSRGEISLPLGGSVRG